MREYVFFVYIMASKSRVLYTGMTNDLRFRVYEHKTGRLEGFTKRYRIHRLVYFEQYRYVYSAIAREKQIKNWIRQKRVALIESVNPTWEDLADKWFSEEELRAKPGHVAVIKYNPDLVQTFGGPSTRASVQPQSMCERNYVRCSVLLNDGPSEEDDPRLSVHAKSRSLAPQNQCLVVERTRCGARDDNSLCFKSS